MRNKIKYLNFVIILLIVFVLLQCQTPKELSFIPKVVSTGGENWWAKALADINQDGYLDFAVIHNNARGGWLGWYEAVDQGATWKKHLIAETAPDGGTFACGDLEVGDIDNDGDIDILGIAHQGEWDGSDTPSKIYWYENPSWKATYIGEVDDFIKNISLADLNQDGKLDIVTVTYEDNHLFSVIKQNSPDSWEKVFESAVWNLHEGMDVGDIDGDGDLDAAANGYWVKNPGNEMKDPWEVLVIDSMWFSQTGDWSKNATDVFCRDINNDGRVEVFITHSEREDYPVAWYGLENINKNQWSKNNIGTLSASQTLDVYDFDLDGDFDVMAGENGHRWNDPEDPVILYLNQGDNQTWEEFSLTTKGIYNGLVGDVEGDGDLDIWRMTGHGADTLEVWMNQIK